MTVSEEFTRGGTGSGDPGAGLLRSAVRRDIVDTLANLPGQQRAEGLSARELGDLVGLHVTTVRFHVTRLIEAGLLTSRSERTPGAGRPTKKYLVSPGSLTGLPDDAHRRLAALLTETFGACGADGQPLDAESVGVEWARQHVPRPEDPAPSRTAGEWLGSVGVLVDTLRTWGYTPEVRTEDPGRTARIGLVDCPFIDLARSHPAVTCGIHRGLLRGTLAVLGEDDVEVSLEPFVGPNHCLAHVTTRADFAPRGGTS